ncbi:MAG: DUF1778 domain-containing protein [Azoarcus sp.]|jgi:uncharacterized protein (DUF1778 family)|nr:DUF1778 domain-containing protein [Azoarcus sp.]
MTATATARLEARISPELRAMIKRAAEVQGRSITDFVTATLRSAAERAIERAEIIRLSLEDQRRFADALLSPPAPTPAMRRAMDSHDELLRE